jgi:hypothetical protein
MLSIAAVAAAIAARSGFFEPAATGHGIAAWMAVAGAIRVRVAGLERSIVALSCETDSKSNHVNMLCNYVCLLHFNTFPYL